MNRFNNRLMPTATEPFDTPYPTEAKLKQIYARTKGIEVSYYDTMDVYDLVQGFKALDARSVVMMWSIVGISGFVFSLFFAIGFVILASGSGAGWAFIVFMVFILAILVREISHHYRRQKQKANS